MPLDDWQFWVVTALAAIGLWRLKRAVWPKSRRGGRKRVQLTIEKRKV